MLSTLFSATTIPVLEQVANFAQSRHEVLSGNIANIDTPGYRTRDLNTDVFQHKLKAAIEASKKPGAQNVSLGQDYTGNDITRVRDGLKSMLYHDDTNIGLEQQATELAKNQMVHNLALTVLGSQFQLLGAAISEKA
jgi:flagellar basal-body rod protein FlgB